MIIDQAHPADIYDVALAMRESDYREFSGVSWAETREELAQDLAQRFGGREDIIVARNEGKSVAIGAMVEARPNVITLFFLATDDLPLIGKNLTRWILKELFPRYRAQGVHRIECVLLEDHTEAREWVDTLGLTLEATCPMWGKNGETYVQYAWTKKHVGALSS